MGLGAPNRRGKNCGRDFGRRVLPDDRRALVAGMAEIPIVIVVSQRTGPSTGSQYTGQAELQFVLHRAGGVPRFIVAPADPGEAYRWSAAAIRLAWRYQIPAFVLTDKTLSEGTYSVDYDRLSDLPGPIPYSGTGRAPIGGRDTRPDLPARVPGQERCGCQGEQLCT